MAQYKRVGHDFTCDMENPDPQHWEPVADAEAPAPEAEPTEAPAPEGSES